MESPPIEDRRRMIVELLGKKGRVRVSELSRLFNTSEVTIRCDLSDLEAGGLVERVHGGAVNAGGGYRSLSYAQRKSKNADQKTAIAALAAQMVREGETLFLNSGVTTHFIAQRLAHLPRLNVVTNSIAIAQVLGQQSGFNVVLLGGNVNAQYQFTHSEDAIEQLRRYHADRLILSVDGISAQHGITTYHYQETAVNRLMIERADRTIVVADASKLGRESFSLIAPVQQVQDLVTSAGAEAARVEALIAAGVAVHLAD